ncbi:MAG: hypothetical protein M3417_05760, partial [Actinomycetota bacterium]|nr:hypothetical protein [Actinomycetota bacterium]
NVAVGLGDQNASMFSAPAYKALKLKKTRYFIGWNAASKPDQLARADAFVRAARSARVKVFMHISDPDFRRNKGKLPSVKQYKSSVGKLVRRYKRLGVKEWGVWNEANHDSQSTFKNPKRAAQYFGAMRSICRRCTIVALDVLDQRGVEGYVRRWYAAVPRSQRRFARIVGIHNYSDTNRKRSTGTARIIKEVKRRDSTRTAFWLTETGGVVAFGGFFPCSEKRAANRVAYMFTLAKKFRRDIKRLYSYNWQGTDCTTRFDAGLVRLDGTTRPAYDTFKKALRSFAR